jgi:hypothetical protein
VSGQEVSWIEPWSTLQICRIPLKAI